MSGFDAIPVELRERPQWVLWKREDRAGAATKVPYRVDLRGRANTTDASTWGTFEEALETVSAADGIGYVFAPDDPYVGIDIDEGMSEFDRGAITLALDSYSEFSVSGQGVHVIVRANLNGYPRNRRGPIEVYDQGRYFVMTGAHVRGTPATINDRQGELEMVLAQYLPKREQHDPRPLPAVPVDLDDEELLEKAMAARNGPEFRALWEGVWEDGYPSQSEAELALCSKLAFWTGRDPDRIDRLFRSSGLMREKWLRNDYRERTIQAAIGATTDIYEPGSTSSPTSSRPRPSGARNDLVPSSLPLQGGRGRHLVPDLVPDLVPWRVQSLVDIGANPPNPPAVCDLLYPSYNHLVFGESEALKTWLVAAASASELAAGRGVLWVDGDDVGAGALLERLRLLGAEDEVIDRLFAYIAPDEPLTEERRNDLLEVVQARQTRLAVFDGFNPLLILHGLDPNSGPDVERFYRLLDPFRKQGAANVVTDNVVKSRQERGKWAIGSERKKTKAEVHLGMRSVGAQLTRGAAGKAVIGTHKDRPGHLTRPNAGVFVLDTSGARVQWRIEPDTSHDAEGTFRPTRLMEKVSRYLASCEEPPPRDRVEKDVEGKADALRLAMDTLIREGYAAEREGPRGARLMVFVSLFTEEADEVARLSDGFDEEIPF